MNITNNTAGNYGGGICFSEGVKGKTTDEVIITSTTLSGNKATTGGGGLHVNTVVKLVEGNIKNNESYCSIGDVLNNTCHEGKMDLNNINDVKDYFKEIMNGRKEGDEDSFYKKIKTGNVVIQYGTMEEQKNANDKEASSIDLGDCEQKLKAQNGISPENNASTAFRDRPVP